MRTAEQMVDYCDLYGLGQGITKGWRLRHFKVIEEQLTQNEDVDVCFIGLHNYVSPTSHGGYYAYAITQSRMIVAQKKVVGHNVQSINLSNLNDITLKTGIIWGVLTFDTYKEKLNVALEKGVIKNIHDIITGYLMSIKKESESISTIQNNISGVKRSPFDQIKEYKELLDMGIITEEEFNGKKNEILGL